MTTGVTTAPHPCGVEVRDVSRANGALGSPRGER